MANLTPFEYEDYKEFVRAWVKAQPSRGRGLFRQIAQHLRVHSTFISQVFKGQRDLSPEQSLSLSRFLDLDYRGAEHLLALVELQRTSSVELRTHITRRLEAQRAEHRSIEKRLPATQKMTAQVQARFYSQWFYSAIRLSTDIPGLQRPEAIASYLGLPLSCAHEATDFLAEHGLVRRDGQDLHIGPSATHVGAASAFVASHHRNWRIKAMERHPFLGKNELAFSAPMALAVSDLTKIRELVLQLIQKVDDTVAGSPSETLAFLNVDLIKFPAFGEGR